MLKFLRKYVSGFTTLSAVVLTASGVPTASGMPSAADSDQASSARRLPGDLVGSWVTTYQIAQFGGAVPILLSFTADGIVIESDTPSPTPVGFGSFGSLVLSNGHGAWKQTSSGTYQFTYRKQIYQTDSASVGLDESDGVVTVSSDGQSLQISNVKLQFTDNNGNVFFSASGTGTATRVVVSAP